MKKSRHFTVIGNIKINNISKGVSINYGPSIHKGYQANSKIETGEMAIGDEYSINYSNSNGEDE